MPEATLLMFPTALIEWLSHSGIACEWSGISDVPPLSEPLTKEEEQSSKMGYRRYHRVTGGF